MAGAGAEAGTDGPGFDAGRTARLCHEHWGLARVAVIERPVSDAGSVSLYRLTSDEGAFLLKQHAAAYAVEDVERGGRTAALLAARGFPTPALRTTRSGAMTARADGRLYSLRPWIEGQVLERRQVTPAHVARLGAVLGWCHGLLADVPAEAPFDWSSGPRRVVQELDDLTARVHARPGQVATDELVLEVLAHRRALFELVGDLSPRLASCPVQVVHGDYHRGNVLWGPDGSLAGVIDVEGWTQHRVREVYRAIVYLQLRETPATINLPLARTFVRGYLEEAPLTPEELRRGPELLRWRLLRGMTNFRAYLANPHDRDAVARIAWDHDLVRWLARHGEDVGDELARAADAHGP